MWQFAQAWKIAGLMSEESKPNKADRISLIGRILGPALFAGVMMLTPPEGLPPAAQRLAAVAIWMAVYWLTQAVPIAITSLLPLVAFPLCGIQPADDVSNAYINKNIFLFLGGFIIALGIEKWGLHRRLALHIIAILGASAKRVVLGFMLATAFLSMWISNTASTLLMLPIGIALLSSLSEIAKGQSDSEQDSAPIEHLAVVLMLGIAYSASIGGFTTLVGTPTNITFTQIWSSEFPDAPEISAGDWMIGAVPLGVVFLACVWAFLTCRLKPIPGVSELGRGFFYDRVKELGSPSRAEWQMLFIFVLTGALWIFRKPLVFGGQQLVPGWGAIPAGWLTEWGIVDASKWVHDSTVAIGMALIMFALPAKKNEHGKTIFMMDWKTAERLPWSILLLIGGGFALAGAFKATGLAQWIGDEFSASVANWPVWLLVAAICCLLTFLTEITSNVATVSALLPILAGICVNLNLDPRLILIPATISTSCAFMLPIATPPNAIVFGSGRIQMSQMARYGTLINLFGVVLITVFTFLVIVPLFGISIESAPDWAK